METKFYEFSQNNTGGSFVTDDKLCHKIIIEAVSEEEAIQRAEDLGCYWDGVMDGIDCPCCGDRWHPFPSEIDLSEWKKAGLGDTIEQYAQYYANQYGYTTPDSRIFYIDGRITEIFINGIQNKHK